MPWALLSSLQTELSQSQPRRLENELGPLGGMIGWSIVKHRKKGGEVMGSVEQLGIDHSDTKKKVSLEFP